MTVWTDILVAIVGGDRRETEIASLARSAGARVRIFGCPPPQDEEIEVALSLERALRQARVAVMPVPLIGPDGSLYAPHAEQPIFLTEAALFEMETPAHVVIGKADANLEEAAARTGVTIHEYESDSELMMLRAPAIAEGAIRVAIERSPLTLHDANVGVMGFGRIASVLVRSLIALNARVHVFARRAEARAQAYAAGAAPHAFDELPGVFPTLDVLYNSVPVRMLGKKELSYLADGTLVVDLAAPPGGVDLEAAEELRLDAFWARGLGASAPRTVARSQWTGIDRIITAALQEDRAEP